MKDKPLSKTAFERAVAGAAYKTGVTSEFVTRLIVNLVVCQIIERETPADCALKGGFSLQLLAGLENARTTKDLDLSIKMQLEQTKKMMLALTGHSLGPFRIQRVIAKPEKTKTSAPAQYRLVELEFQLTYANSQFRTVTVEISKDELDDSDQARRVPINIEIRDLCADLKLPVLTHYLGISAELQIAQKLHAVTQRQSDRGHDLHDIAYLVKNNEINHGLLKSLTNRTFSYRASHDLPIELLQTQVLRETFLIRTKQLKQSISFDEALSVVNELLRIATAK